MLQQSRRRSGATMVLAVISLAAILGVAAITLEGGLLLHQRRGLQAAADAAALAAAENLYANYRTGNGLDGGGTATAAANASAVANGYPQTDVTVHIPPSKGIAKGKAGYAEVTIQVSQPRGFSALFGSGPNVVSARAVARGQWITSNNAIVLLDPTSAGALTVAGNGKLKSDGPVVIDSNSGQAAETNGSNAKVTATAFDITGSPGTSGSGFTGTVNPSQTATPNPLAYLPTPTAPTGSSQNQSSNPLSPGLYVGGIQLSGGSITMQPGIYYLQGGGFSLSGKVSVTGTGVMIYNAPSSSSDAISIAGQASLTLSPMTTGIYQGISIFQAPTSTVPLSIAGKGTINITGTIYAADATFNVSGNGTTNNYGSQYIGADLSVAGNGTVNVNTASGSTANTRLVGLVE